MFVVSVLLFHNNVNNK